MIDRLRRELIRDEGLKLHAYQDSLGYWTIGVGRLIDKRKGGGISASEAMYLLDNDIAEKIGELRTALPWFDSLNTARQCVLVNMGFNLGVPGLLKFKTTLALVKDGEYAEAARAMLQSKWATQVGDRARRLAAVMESGE